MGSPASGWTAVNEAPPAASGWTAVDETPHTSADQGGGGFLSHVGSTLAAAPGAIAQTIAHPLDSLKAWRDQSQTLHDAAVDSAQQGDYRAAAEHGLNFLANIIPGLGKVMDDARNAGEEHGVTSDEFKAKLGDVVGTALLMKAGEKAPGVVKGAAKAMAAAPAAVMDFARTPGNIQLATGVGQVAGGGGAMVAGHPLGGGVAVLRGFENIGKGMEKRSAAAADSAAKASASTPAAAPGAPDVIPASRQLAAGPIITPPPADTSGVIKGWQPVILENDNPAPGPAAPAAAAPAPDLDGIAQGFGFKDFASVKDPRAAQTIQKVAEQTAAAKEPPPEAAPPGSTAPTPPSPSAPAAPAAVTPPSPATPAPAAFTDTESTGLQIPQVANARARLANNMADYFHKGGMTLAEIESRRGQPAAWQSLWENAGKASGSKQASSTPSADTVEATLTQLEAREKAAPAAAAAPDMAEQLQQSIDKVIAEKMATRKARGQKSKIGDLMAH